MRPCLAPGPLQQLRRRHPRCRGQPSPSKSLPVHDACPASRPPSAALAGSRRRGRCPPERAPPGCPGYTLAWLSFGCLISRDRVRRLSERRRAEACWRFLALSHVCQRCAGGARPRALQGVTLASLSICNGWAARLCRPRRDAGQVHWTLVSPAHWPRCWLQRGYAGVKGRRASA